MIYLYLLGTFLFSIVGVVYFIYFINLPSDSPKPEVLDDEELPKISIVIPAHNEEKNIMRRITNIVNGSYPIDKIEVVIVNDASEDDTVKLSLTAFEGFEIKGKVVNNEKQMGVNKTMERGILAAKNDIVVCTDADVSFDVHALKLVVSKLVSKFEIGGVSGDLQPLLQKNLTTKTEESYRSVYGGMCEWESNVASTFGFNGALYAFKKYAPLKLHIESGAYDAGIALSIIRNGFKTCYLQSAKVFENNIPVSMKEQVRQKIRRASRLIRATGNNIDLLWKCRKNKFGRIVFPLRFLAFFVVPFCFFAGVGVWLYISSLFDLLLISISLPIIYVLYSNIVYPFVIHQFYLLCGLLNYFGQKETWRLVKR